jgi:predicted nuclease with TOPRIM domain
MSNNAKECDERNASLREEKEAIQSHFQSLKYRMNEFREEEHAKLTEMTVLSNGSIKNLESKVEKAEKILKLAEMNRKLETEREKVLPFYEESTLDISHEVGLFFLNPSSLIRLTLC